MGPLPIIKTDFIELSFGMWGNFGMRIYANSVGSCPLFYEQKWRLINEIKLIIIWAFPAIRRVGLYATSPRFAVSFSLQSLTQIHKVEIIKKCPPSWGRVREGSLPQKENQISEGHFRYFASQPFFYLPPMVGAVIK